MEFGINKEKEKTMKNNVNPFKQIAIFSVAVFLAILFILSIPTAAKKPWDGVVHAPLKTAKLFDWSAPDEFFTGKSGVKSSSSTQTTDSRVSLSWPDCCLDP